MENQSAKERLTLEHEQKKAKAEQELKRKQEAERNAREMSKDELDLLQAAHQARWDCTFVFCSLLSFNYSQTTPIKGSTRAVTRATIGGKV